MNLFLILPLQLLLVFSLSTRIVSKFTKLPLEFLHHVYWNSLAQTRLWMIRVSKANMSVHELLITVNSGSAQIVNLLQNIHFYCEFILYKTCKSILFSR